MWRVQLIESHLHPLTTSVDSANNAATGDSTAVTAGAAVTPAGAQGDGAKVVYRGGDHDCPPPAVVAASRLRARCPRVPRPLVAAVRCSQLLSARPPCVPSAQLRWLAWVLSAPATTCLARRSVRLPSVRVHVPPAARACFALVSISVQTPAKCPFSGSALHRVARVGWRRLTERSHSAPSAVHRRAGVRSLPLWRLRQLPCTRAAGLR
jgi:hypothetical protein